MGRGREGGKEVREVEKKDNTHKTCVDLGLTCLLEMTYTCGL